MKDKTLLIAADAAVDTGFAKVTHSLIQRFAHNWNVHVLAVNYDGDYHPISQHAKLYNPRLKSLDDFYGFNRLAELQQRLVPDVTFYINDPWVLNTYIDHALYNTTNVFYAPVDAVNIKPAFTYNLHKFTQGIAYTQFGVDVLAMSGYTDPMYVVPHGIDTSDFFPMDKREVRAAIKNRNLVLNVEVDDYIVQVVDRNSLRKRIDLALYGFAIWARDKPKNVKLWYHGSLVDEGYDIAQLAEFFGIADRMIYTATNLNPAHGVSVSVMNAMYNAADVRLSTSGGEGWSLCTMESMATKTANMVVNTAALSEWARGGVHYIRPSEIPLVTLKGLNTIHAQADIQDLVFSLEKMYVDNQYRDYIAQQGYDLVTQDMYTWDSVALSFEHIFEDVLKRKDQTSVETSVIASVEK